MTTKKPKAPVKKTTPAPKKPAKPSTGGKPSLSQQRRLRALRGTQVAPSTPEGRVEPTESFGRWYKLAPDGVNRIYEDGSQTLVGVPQTFRELRDDNEKALGRQSQRDPVAEWNAAVQDSRERVVFEPLDQSNNKRLAYIGMGVVALGVVVYYGGFL